MPLAKIQQRFVCVSLLLLITSVARAAEYDPTKAVYTLVAAKVVVDDLKQSQTFYQDYFGLKEVSREQQQRSFEDGYGYDEVVLGFDAGVRLTLMSSPKEQGLQKSRYPVVLIYTPDFEAVVKRLEDAKQPVRRLPKSQSGPYRIAIARDPSGNAVEVLARDKQPAAIGAAKLIVADREEAEHVYTLMFSAKPLQYFNTPSYDEVLLRFNDGMLALFQPKDEAPLPKSKMPVVTFRHHMTDPAATDSRGFSQDPSNNVFEILEVSEDE